jgi:hypothetical protein
MCHTSYNTCFQDLPKTLQTCIIWGKNDKKCTERRSKLNQHTQFSPKWIDKCGHAAMEHPE